MPHDPKLLDDLETLAAAERQRLGESPDLEQLAALRDGRLAEAEAERLRDRMAIDPELAATYLELKRAALKAVDDASAQAGAEADVSDADVEDAWQQLSPRLDREAQEGADPGYEAEEVASFPDRRWMRVLSLAATLTLAVGLVWLLARDGPQKTTPETQVQPFRIAGLDLRDPRLRIFDDVTHVAFQIDAAELDSSAEYIVELLDRSGQSLQSERLAIEGEPKQLAFKVASKVLEEGRSYQLRVRAADASPGDPPSIHVVFQPIFEPRPRSSGRSQSACQALDPLIAEAIQVREGGDWQAAETAYSEILLKASAQDCRLHEGKVWNARATVAILEGRLRDSLDLLQKAGDRLSAAAPAADKDPAVFEQAAVELKARIELNHGIASFRLGWLAEAEQAFRRARSLNRLRNANPDAQARLLLQLARVYRLRGEIDEARASVRAGLEQDFEHDKLLASLWQETAWIEMADDRLDSAEAALERAVEALGSADDSAKANLHVDLAALRARQKRWAESLTWVETTLELAEATESQDLNLEAQARHLQSVAMHALGDLEGATHAADLGLDLLESVRDAWSDQGIHFFALRQKHYRHRLDLAAAAGAAPEAWRIFESYRAQNLLENAGVRLRRPQDSPSPPNHDAMLQVRLDLLDAVRQLDRWHPDLGQEVREFRQARLLELRQRQRSLRAAARQAAGLGPLPSEVDSAEALGMLGRDTLGVVFAGGVDRFHVLILDPRQGVEILPLSVDRHRIQALVEHVLLGLDPRAAGEAQDLLDARLHELGRAVLAPLETYLDSFRRLAIVADGPLDHLPFDALRHPKTGQSLVESHEIVHLPSFSVLGALRQRAADCSLPTSEILAMGDPVFSSADPRWPLGVDDARNLEDVLGFRRLPATHNEVARIAESYRDAVPILGPNATRERFLAEASSHRVIHLASHAWSDSRVPERSKIAFSCVDSEHTAIETCDLYFVDVLDLELCGQSVVLSACQTAGGLAVEGEGTLGLPWAFLRAGASTVVASRWQVGDQAAAELMSVFHHHLRGGLEPSAALRQAKLTLLRRGDPTSDWAAFVLIGDWQANPFFEFADLNLFHQSGSHSVIRQTAVAT